MEAEQDELDSSGGSMFALLDTSAGGDTNTGVKRHSSSCATGGRSGLKRPTHEKTPKPETKRRLANRSSVDSIETDQPTAGVNEMSMPDHSGSVAEELEHRTAGATGQRTSSEKRCVQRTTRRNSDLKPEESDSMSNDRDGVAETGTVGDLCEETNSN